MKKSISATLAVLSSFCMMCMLSCGKKNKDSNKDTDENISVVIEKETEITEPTESITTAGQVTTNIPKVTVPTENSGVTEDGIFQLTVRNDSFTELNHENALQIEMPQYEQKIMDVSVQGKTGAMKSIGDKIIVEIYPDDEPGTLETGLFDPYSNTYETISRMPFSAAYGNYSYVSQDRYFVMIYSSESAEGLSGKVMVYDAETEESSIIDEYDIYNIVQYVTPVGERGIAYFYYESGTQDWIVKYYNISSGTSEEIFRHTNFGDIPASPVAIAADGEEIVLAVQYMDDICRTQFVWISTSGDACATEEADLHNFFDGDYEITDVIINNDIYYVKALVNGQEEYFFFTREDKNFYVTLPAICRLNTLVDEEVTDESDILFMQDNKILGDLIRVDLSADTLCSYSFIFTDMENDAADLNQVKITDSGDLIAFFGDDTSEIRYQIISNYRSIDTKMHDFALYEPPTDKELLSNNDFRWRFVYK